MTSLHEIDFNDIRAIEKKLRLKIDAYKTLKDIYSGYQY